MTPNEDAILEYLMKDHAERVREANGDIPGAAEEGADNGE